MTFTIMINEDNTNGPISEEAIRGAMHECSSELLGEGYLYFEQICRILGREWNPYEPNDCFIYERDGALRYDVYRHIYDDSEYIINIYTTTTKKGELP